MKYGNLKSEVDNSPVLPVSKAIVNNIFSGGDPIGDALRLVCSGYWKLDEEVQPYADSVGTADLIGSEDPPPLVSAVGKINNAVGYVDQPGGFNGLYSLNPSGTFIAWSVSTWIKINNTTDIGDAADLIDCPNTVTLSVENNNSMFLYQTLGGVGQSLDNPVTPNEWHHVVVTSNGTNKILYIDNVSVDTSLSFPEISSIFYPFNWLLTGGWNNTDSYYLDEIGLFNVVITPEQVTYLYNSGNGRTLYP